VEEGKITKTKVHKGLFRRMHIRNDISNLKNQQYGVIYIKNVIGQLFGALDDYAKLFEQALTRNRNFKIHYSLGQLLTSVNIIERRASNEKVL